VKYWEIIADNLSKAGWSWGCVSAIDSNGRTIWITDAHRGDGKRFVVRADEKLTASTELEAAIRVYIRIVCREAETILLGLIRQRQTYSSANQRSFVARSLSRRASIDHFPGPLISR
jgi:hypothetical protein